MSQAEYYELTYPDLPANLQLMKRIFLEQPQRRGPGYEKAQREAERLRRKKIEEVVRKKQTGLF